MHKKVPTILAILALLAIPVALVIEKTTPEVWRDRLAIPNFEAKLNRHTPLQTEGAVLPPKITKSTTLTTEQNPIIVVGTVEVPTGITLTLNPGVHLYTHEFSEISVFGTLRMQGAEKQPIILTTNERHPMNQLWNGVIVKNGGNFIATHTEFHYASPALTCEKGATGSLTQSEVHEALIGIFTNSATCTFSDNRIESIRDSIISKL